MFYVLICFFVMSTGFEVQFNLVLCDVLAYNLELFHPQWQSSTFFLIYSSSHLLKSHTKTGALKFFKTLQLLSNPLSYGRST